MNTITEPLSIYSIARAIERDGILSAADYNLELIERHIKGLGIKDLSDPLLDETEFRDVVRAYSVR